MLQLSFEFLEHPPYCFTQWLPQFTFPSTVHEGSFDPHPCQHLSSLVFLILAILTGAWWYFIVIFICISLMINDLSIFSCTCWPSGCLLLYKLLGSISGISWTWPLYSEGKEIPKTGAGSSRLVGDSFNEQGNLLTSLVLDTHMVSSFLHPPTKSFF